MYLPITMKHTTIAYAAYRRLPWTSDADKCERCDDVILAEGSYVEGDLGHYCGERCRADAEDDDHPSDAACRASERRQMCIEG
jgi:hypothetical protein